MRKLSRPQEPDDFAAVRQRFSQHYPPAAPKKTEGERWTAFKNEEQEMYGQIKTKLLDNQQGLCAFCECKLTDNNREIEHFQPKSQTTVTQDWTICFGNYTLSCKGRRSTHDDDHCGHLKDNMNPEGNILCPYDLPDFPLVKLVSTDKKIRLVPDTTACRKAGIGVERVQLSLDYLGLNCKTLCESRWEVWNSLLDQIADIDILPKNEQAVEWQSIIDDNLAAENTMLKSFITTRKLVIAEYA